MATHCSILCLENSLDRRAWRTTVHGVAKRVGYDLVSEPACTVLSCFNSRETAACVHGLHTVVSTNSFSQKCEAMCVENI